MKQDYIYKVQSVVDTLYDVIGLFEGANYYQTGWYRPSMKCIMQGSGTSCTFCKICLEYLTFKFLSSPHSVIRKKDDYEWKFPIPGTKKYDYTLLIIDSLYPSPFNDELSGGSIHMSTIQIDKNHHVKIKWFFNGSELEDIGNTLSLSSFTENGTVKAILEISSKYIRNPNYTVVNTIDWQYRSPVHVEKEIRMYVAANSKIRKLANNVYLVPKASYKNFYVNDLLWKKYSFKNYWCR